MQAPRTTIVIALCVAAVSFIAGSWWSREPARPSAAGGRKILYYHDPMHPAYKSDKPGIAPDCGMQLEPVYADGGGDSAPSPNATPMAPGLVRIGLERQQLIGVRTEETRKTDAEGHIRILGRVAADERRIYRLNAPSAGVVREVGTATTGSIVKANETLAVFLTRGALDFRTLLPYLVRPDAQGGAPTTFTPGVPPPTLQTTELVRDQLRLQGMTEEQMAEVAKTRKFTTTINVVSPVAGFVLARNISPEELFQEGTEFFRIADLSSVWVVADLFENEARLLESGAGATVRYQGRTFPAHRSDVPPQFDANTRALKLRLEVSNPGFVLRPDMFVDVDFETRIRSAITLPVDAVLDSGVRKTVFVDRGGGYFEPRGVETGARLGDRIAIASGLAPGERVVVSGNFLIDSESRLQSAASGTAGQAADRKDPVCGMDVDPAKTAHKFEYRGKTYYFCSDSCKTKFAADPEKYARTGGAS